MENLEEEGEEEKDPNVATFIPVNETVVQVSSNDTLFASKMLEFRAQQVAKWKTEVFLHDADGVVTTWHKNIVIDKSPFLRRLDESLSRCRCGVYKNPDLHLILAETPTSVVRSLTDILYSGEAMLNDSKDRKEIKLLAARLQIEFPSGVHVVSKSADSGESDGGRGSSTNRKRKNMEEEEEKGTKELSQSPPGKKMKMDLMEETTEPWPEDAEEEKVAPETDTSSDMEEMKDIAEIQNLSLEEKSPSKTVAVAEEEEEEEERPSPETSQSERVDNSADILSTINEEEENEAEEDQAEADVPAHVGAVGEVQEEHVVIAAGSSSPNNEKEEKQRKIREVMEPHRTLNTVRCGHCWEIFDVSYRFREHLCRHYQEELFELAGVNFGPESKKEKCSGTNCRFSGNKTALTRHLGCTHNMIDEVLDQYEKEELEKLKREKKTIKRKRK